MILRKIRNFYHYLKIQPRHAKHNFNVVFKKTFHDLHSIGFNPTKKTRILDLGCGEHFSFALLCALNGFNITALDQKYVKPNVLPLAFLKMIKYNGLKYASKSIIKRLFIDRKYYYELEKLVGESLKSYYSQINFVVADPLHKHYPLDSETFDLICSNAVIEHVKDLPLFVSEVCRLLTKNGYFYGIIHNFYSLSGGHVSDWADPDEAPAKKVPPWDHLLENRFSSLVYLNRLLPEEYKKIFSQYLKIILFEGRDKNHNPDGFEGKQILTPKLLMQLHNYHQELLLTRSWCIICNKR